jgi:prepilin-type N-terminal cleavage/methylation domain-containing protein
MKRKTTIRVGFTLVELLTTLAVIGILLGLLIPALNMVSKTATKVKQKAQFHAIGTALETFRNDYGDYPPSKYDPTYGNYCASQRLAEAIVGRDGLGFHSASRFNEDGLDASGNPLYYPDFTPADNVARDANLAARKGPYLELESANAVKLSNLPLSHNFPLTPPSYVLVDMYKIVKNSATGKQTGMPILYYKADKTKIGHDPMAPWLNNIYNFNDSYCASDGFSDIAIAEAFYKATLNPNFTSPQRPYRAESFLLHSAGEDGLYGTMDDIFNFDQDN